MAKRVESVGDIAALRQTWQKFVPAVVRGEFVGPVTMVNNGYLHALNASFDGLFLREQQSDSLLVANHPMNFGTFQPCVRVDDKPGIKKSPVHLGLFEIWGTSVLGFEQLSPSQMAERTIREFLIFYTDYLKLDPNALRIYYFGGGTLKNITGGRTQCNDYVEPDDFSVDIWTNHGLKQDQLIPEYSNETFLLHLGNPLREHHSGFRNDIFIDIGDNSYEIATLNFISHQSVVEEEKITGIKPLPFYLREIAIGQERILAAINNSDSVFELPHISPLLEKCAQSLEDPNKAIRFTDALRAVHYIISDGWTFDKLKGKKYREHRHELRGFMKTLATDGNKFSGSELEIWLNLNAQLQPWHQTLKPGVKATIDEIYSFFS